MANELNRRVARVDKSELSDLPAPWTDRQRGRYLRLLLWCKGIDSRRFFRVEYYPHPRCWLLLQEDEPDRPRELSGAGQPDELFYRQALTEFRRVARAAYAALAGCSTYFARSGRVFQVPGEARALQPAELVNLLGPNPAGRRGVRFDSQGGWRSEPSEN
jgi:hypothetical protein